MKGYKVTKPSDTQVSKYIEISAEQGGLDPRVKEFIESTFNVIHYDTDA